MYRKGKKSVAQATPDIRCDDVVMEDSQPELASCVGDLTCSDGDRCPIAPLQACQYQRMFVVCTPPLVKPPADKDLNGLS